MDLTRNRSLKAPTSAAGPLAGATVASLLAGVLIFSALQKDDGGSTSAAPAAPVSVIVADRLIPKGSPGEAVAAGKIAQPVDVRAAEVSGGAVTDISDIRGKVATHDIYPGEQLTIGDFETAGAGTLTTKLTGSVRGMSIPIDQAHGLVGQVQPGDHVDVFASLKTKAANGDEVPILKPLASNVEVLKTPKAAADGEEKGADEASVVTLRMVGKLAAQLAFASDNGKVWIVLRPPTGAVENPKTIVTLRSLLASGQAGVPTGSVVQSGGTSTKDSSTAGAGSGRKPAESFTDATKNRKLKTFSEAKKGTS